MVKFKFKLSDFKLFLPDSIPGSILSNARFVSETHVQSLHWATEAEFKSQIHLWILALPGEIRRLEFQDHDRTLTDPTAEVHTCEVMKDGFLSWMQSLITSW